MLRTRKKFRFGKKRDGSAGRPPSLPYRIGDNDELPILDQQVQIVQDLFFPPSSSTAKERFFSSSIPLSSSL